MSNIPRRKIYEELLIFEEGILEIDRLVFSKENIEIFKKDLPAYLEKVENSYKNIKSLLLMFLENKIFENEEDFENELSYYLANQKEVSELIKKNKNLQKSFYQNCLIIEDKIKNIQIEDLKEFLINLDKFNSAIPKILEIRRDEMK